MQAFRLAVRKTAIGPAKTRAIATSMRTSNISSHMVDPDKAAEQLEQGKKDSIAGAKNPDMKKHAPGWNETVASESEAFIKAEAADASSPQDLVKETVQRVTEKHGKPPVSKKST